jgi:8-oxo-dGTP diphosphatase
VSQPPGNPVIDHWTGRHATALQAALRMSQDEMAGLLGVAKRTIASWHERPEVVIRPELQRALDTAYERAPESAKLRFARQAMPSPSRWLLPWW